MGGGGGPAFEWIPRGADQVTHVSESAGCRLGLLAFGDSITNGGGELQWGVALQSWAMWAARGLGIPYSPYAMDGAAATDVLERQIPLFERANAGRRPRYELGCLYVGTNDVRTAGFDSNTYERTFASAVRFLGQCCDTVLTATIPLDMGRPRSPAQVESVNEVIERVAGTHGALVLDLRRFGGRQVMMFDHVHPTALGQIAIAEQALTLLARNGFDVRLRPSELVAYDTTPVGRLRSDLTYAYRHLKQDARVLRAARRR